ncbi:hypothetical protein FQR65_LT15969 [Abscondita terminalis]|nr:hypothetical protein FQR65_LT15969 [Abscondita terminalis]
MVRGIKVYLLVSDTRFYYFRGFYQASRKVVKAKTSDILTSDNSYIALKRRKIMKTKLHYSTSANQYSSEDGDLYQPPKQNLKMKKINAINKNRCEGNAQEGPYKKPTELVQQMSKLCSYSQEGNLNFSSANVDDDQNQNSSPLIDISKNQDISQYSSTSQKFRENANQIQSGPTNTSIRSETDVVDRDWWEEAYQNTTIKDGNPTKISSTQDMAIWIYATNENKKKELTQQYPGHQRNRGRCGCTHNNNRCKWTTTKKNS